MRTSFADIRRELDKLRPKKEPLTVLTCHYRPIFQGSAEKPEYNTVDDLKAGYKEFVNCKKGSMIIFYESVDLPPRWSNWYDFGERPPVVGYRIIRERSYGYPEFERIEGIKKRAKAT